MTITIVSADAAGNEGNNQSVAFSSGLHNVSADGRYVTFYSSASNLVAGDSNNTPDIFVKDTQTGAIQRVSTDGAGAQANNQSYYPSISADGRYLTFSSPATPTARGIFLSKIRRRGPSNASRPMAAALRRTGGASSLRFPPTGAM